MAGFANRFSHQRHPEMISAGRRAVPGTRGGAGVLCAGLTASLCVAAGNVAVGMAWLQPMG